MERRLDRKKVQEFTLYLKNEEKSGATIEKYLRDVKYFVSFAGKELISRERVLCYKSKLGEEYAVSSANSMIAALNCFFRFCGWQDFCAKAMCMTAR